MRNIGIKRNIPGKSYFPPATKGLFLIEVEVSLGPESEGNNFFCLWGQNEKVDVFYITRKERYENKNDVKDQFHVLTSPELPAVLILELFNMLT